MRSALYIFAAAAIAFGVSWWCWSDLLSPTLPNIGPEPSVWRRQFGAWIPPGLEAEMERRLPADFKSEGPLERVLPLMGHPSRIIIHFDWKGIEGAGGKREAPVSTRVGGMKLGDALLAILAEQKPPLACIADDDMLALTITTPYKRSINRMRKVHTVADLAATPPEQKSLLAQIQAHVAPQTWGASATHVAGEMVIVAGQLSARASAATQWDIAKYLNELRVRRARTAFAVRAGPTVGGTIVVVAAVLLISRAIAWRKRAGAGLCRLCGYDLRASSGRCPECGTVFAPAPAESAPALTP